MRQWMSGGRSGSLSPDRHAKGRGAGCVRGSNKDGHTRAYTYAHTRTHTHTLTHSHTRSHTHFSPHTLTHTHVHNGATTLMLKGTSPPPRPPQRLFLCRPALSRPLTDVEAGLLGLPHGGLLALGVSLGLIHHPLYTHSFRMCHHPSTPTHTPPCLLVLTNPPAAQTHPSATSRVVPPVHPPPPTCISTPSSMFAWQSPFTQLTHTHPPSTTSPALAPL
jgi:hypothetical protein